jgi:hypothetical protein
MNTAFEPAHESASDDGGIISSTPNDPTVRPPAAEVTSTDATPSPDCPPLSRPTISEFTFTPGGNPRGTSFGEDASFQGGTYFYPSDRALTSSVTDGNWHLSGTVDTISGFGLFLNACQPMDASAFSGIAFTLWGNIEGDRTLAFFIESAAHQVSSQWINANKANPEDPDVLDNSGRCFPAASRYDGTCREPRVMLELTSEPTTVEIPWADFAGGSPVPALDASEITAIAWSLPQPDDTPYSVDIHIDDLRFIAP